MACIQVNCKPVALERNGIVKMVRVKIRPKKKKGNAKDRQHCGSGIEISYQGMRKNGKW